MSNHDQDSALREKAEGEDTVRPFPARPESRERTAPQEVPGPDVEPAHSAGASADAPKKKKRGLRKMLLPIIGLALLAGGAYYGYHYWTVGRFIVSTDDAYVQADIAALAPKIQGYVASVNFTENQQVKAGDVLVRLEDGDYRIALEQAKAAVKSQQQTLNRIQAQEKAAEASVAQAQAEKQASQATADNAKSTADRARSLLKTRVASQSEVDNADAALASASAKLTGADAQIAAAKANVGVLKAQYAEAESQIPSLKLAIDQAERNLNQTVLRAPYDGVVGNRAVETGDFVSAGQKLAALVPMKKLYIRANLKETQLAGVVPGEKATISVDALDGHTIEGTVASIAPASGSVFSLLPSDNATGNFTKVVQRVPVRIELPKDALDSGRLRAGLSVVADIDTRTAPDAGNPAK
ncbi:HlyD family secretion protein [Pararhizobium mangrovi]|uniref:HlyD family efflux transporter periplasmic adaptor subunit n=1 Tax=Pararhizobium mangrovi TaxID=2590452 RepID=A0A506TZS6_9HYPH|nr:HlyD family secretion protein [Pararhizobium mangrovi]TPW27583.1 HlyD family efflux transporter periplasmic adaptor subunit [Pararhizobium mangrovi]